MMDAAADETPARESGSRKRKADVLGRLEQSSMTHHGRGALVGWTTCPLCGRHSRKRYALGRGIAAHLHAVHTPWKPGKAERKKRRRLNERRRQELRKQENGTDVVPIIEEEECWEPSEEERQEWDLQVLKIAAELEAKANENELNTDGGQEQSISYVAKGLDRNGKRAVSYRKSLPPFVQAAADGDLNALSKFVDESTKSVSLTEIRDRNGSTAEHWAAGGGHLSCLKFLVEKLRKNHVPKDEEKRKEPKRVRRRDGKTCLHFAARNGRVECIKYLLQQGQDIDEQSGDGTTSLHMACYGGHAEAVRLLLQHGANVRATNEWGCGVSHWVGMQSCDKSRDAVRSMCNALKELGVCFSVPQKQGHTALHKAAQRCNRHVIEWMAHSSGDGGAGLSPQERKQAGEPDEGGHKPSDIWRCTGGEESFALWMESELGW